MKAVILNTRNQIVFLADLPEGVREVEVAGTTTSDGAPVNRRTYKVSRSKANIDQASRMDLDTLSRHSYNGLEFYALTGRCNRNDDCNL